MFTVFTPAVLLVPCLLDSHPFSNPSEGLPGEFTLREFTMREFTLREFTLRDSHIRNGTLDLVTACCLLYGLFKFHVLIFSNVVPTPKYSQHHEQYA